MGNVGSTVAKNLLNSGFTVSALLDTNIKAGRELPGDIPRPGYPKELAGMCDVVITALPAPPHVKKVLKGEDGVLAGLRSGGVWIDHSTTDYQQTLELAKEAGMTCFSLACAVQIAKNETNRKLDARDLRTVAPARFRITFYLPTAHCYLGACSRLPDSGERLLPLSECHEQVRLVYLEYTI